MKKTYNAYKISTPFFKVPGLLSGMSRVLDLGCTYDKKELNSDYDVYDAVAIQSDWDAVGCDIRYGIDQWKSCER